MIVFSAFVLWLHILGAIVWVGGTFFLALVLHPVAEPEASARRIRLADHAAARFQAVSWHAVALLLLTGLFNLINAGIGFGFRFSSLYLEVLLAKLALVAAIVGIQAWQSLVLLPKLRPAPHERAPEVHAPLRKRARGAAILFLILAAVVVLLGVSLRYVR